MKFMWICDMKKTSLCSMPNFISGIHTRPVGLMSIISIGYVPSQFGTFLLVWSYRFFDTTATLERFTVMMLHCKEKGLCKKWITIEQTTTIRVLILTMRFKNRIDMHLVLPCPLAPSV